MCCLTGTHVFLVNVQFVNLIWPTSMLSFGPPRKPMISLAPAVAKPCAALLAARLGRSGSRRQRDRDRQNTLNGSVPSGSKSCSNGNRSCARRLPS
jgi:hypothetical protein